MDASSCIIPAGRFPIGVYNSPFDTRPVAFVKFLSPVFATLPFFLPCSCSLIRLATLQGLTFVMRWYGSAEAIRECKYLAFRFVCFL